MTRFIIVVLMTGNFAVGEHDAVEITRYGGMPLSFESLAECTEHVKENYVALSVFAQSQILNKKVKSINCFEVSRHAGVPSAHYSIKSEKKKK